MKGLLGVKAKLRKGFARICIVLTGLLKGLYEGEERKGSGKKRRQNICRRGDYRTHRGRSHEAAVVSLSSHPAIGAVGAIIIGVILGFAFAEAQIFLLKYRVFILKSKSVILEFRLSLSNCFQLLLEINRLLLEVKNLLLENRIQSIQRVNCRLKASNLALIKSINEEPDGGGNGSSTAEKINEG